MNDKTIPAALAAISFVVIPTASAEETVWVSRSTPTLSVTETKSGYVISNGKARLTVARGEKLPAVFQTTKGKVLRAGPGPRP